MRNKILVLFFMIIGTAACGQASVSEEEVKAAFIFNFLKFVQWDDIPPAYNICVPEDKQLRKVFTESLEGKTLNNRRIEVVDRTDTCHVLVSDSFPSSDKTLTIGLLDQGAMFEFLLIDNKLRFAINIDNIRKSKLKISSQLLKLAVTKGQG